MKLRRGEGSLHDRGMSRLGVSLQARKDVRVTRGEVVPFTDVVLQVIQFPGRAGFGLDRLPVAGTDCGLSHELPVEVFVLLLSAPCGGLADEFGEEAEAVDVRRGLRAAELGDGGKDVGEVPQVIADAAGCDAPGRDGPGWLEARKKGLEELEARLAEEKKR